MSHRNIENYILPEDNPTLCVNYCLALNFALKLDRRNQNSKKVFTLASLSHSPKLPLTPLKG